MKGFTREEVSRHRSRSSLWVIHENKVYDVTDFAQRHPGGEDILLQHAGEKVSQVMSGLDPHKHSSAAYQILDKYYIGDLIDDSANNTKAWDTGRSDGISLRSGRTVTSPSHSNNNKASPTSLPSNGVTTTTPSSPQDHDVMLHGRREDDQLVDWSKPIFWQVGTLGEKYDDWVHMPVEGHIRLFCRDWVERFADTPWWIIPIVWTPISVVFLWLSIINIYSSTDLHHFGVRVTLGLVPFYVVFGMLFWSLLEYLVHRWLFHLPAPPQSPFLITMHFILHGQHHKAPFDKDRLVFPPVPGFAFAAVFWAMFSSFLPRPAAYAVMAGSIVGYMCYDLTHYYLHHGTPYFAYFRRLKSYHVKHHFVDYKKGFGISSKLWDYPFGTLIPDNNQAVTEQQQHRSR